MIKQNKKLQNKTSKSFKKADCTIEQPRIINKKHSMTIPKGEFGQDPIRLPENKWPYVLIIIGIIIFILYIIFS